MTSNHDLRIACLEPSATAICLQLGLQDHLVGVTHECHELVQHLDFTSNVHVLTKNGLTVTSQGDIHRAVQASAAAATATSCTLPSSSKNNNNNNTIDDIPSLYPLLGDEIRKARPTVIFTQNLCAVCAPTESDVMQVLLDNENNEASSSSSSTTPACQVISLQPQTLDEVAESYITAARACGVEERGIALKQKWMEQFQTLQQTVQQHRDPTRSIPRVMILEWLDPPFDGGHWTYQMMEFAGIERAVRKDKVGPKSQTMDWNQVMEINPDVILVGCCGFDLKRNVADAHAHADKLEPLRAAQNGHVYACNGNIYIAQPSPSLLQGSVILAKCAYQDQPKVLKAIDELKYFDGTQEDETAAWQHFDVLKAVKDANKKEKLIQEDKPKSSSDIADMEDLIGGEVTALADGSGFAIVHQNAVDKGERTYIDPATGYSVFTELAHKERGWCCGSGCRHCPYSHQNVKDKASKIQQPSIMYRKIENDDDADGSLFSLEHSKIKVLFFSGGKDSFLTIRSLVRQYHQDGPFGLVLITTFDATTRTIAHQNVQVEQVVRQASHLNITLLGIPLRRGSGETYFDRIHKGIAVLEKDLERNIYGLLFGDLHLSHIKEWRDNTFRDVPYTLEYPLWKVPYEQLMQDLEASQVPCEISGTTVEQVKVGITFDRDMYHRAMSLGLDGFGEQGEFHSLAKVWEVPRATALGFDGPQQ